jgi:site-specific recombinase XerD
MSDHFRRRRVTAADARVSPFAAQIDSFAAHLAQLGYAESTIPARMRLVVAFTWWLVPRGLAVAVLGSASVTEFFHQRRRRGTRRRGDVATLERFLGHLVACGVTPAAVPSVEAPSAVEDVGIRYREYLRVERGLAPSTPGHYWTIVHSFLQGRFGDGPVPLAELTADDTTHFLLRQGAPPSPKGAQLEVSVLRSFFGFLTKEGEIDRDLAGAVPPVRRWRVVEVPKYLTSAEVTRVLASCDRGAAVGQRDYAIVLLLARLGLRAGEVVRLELGDVDWRSGELMVRGKGSVHARLPLPAEVGNALATYLHQARPSCPTRRVFVRTRAPYRSLGQASTVSAIVCRAIDKAGLTPATKGAHLFRHSLATDLLRHGASLLEIGELLRHRSPQTTEIYAKVDLDGLRTLARPWPVDGGGR